MPALFNFTLMDILLILLVIAVPVLILVYGVYVSIIKKKNVVEESLSGIDVQLKKRHDLIPNILEIAKKFMSHEKSLLTEITELRTEAVKLADAKGGKNLEKRMQTEAHLDNKLSQLMVNVENYPNLKSDQTMLHAQQTYNEVEEHIAASRRFYNAAVRSLNDTIKIWPMSMIASMVKVEAFPYFEATAEEKGPINAADIL